MSWMSSSTRSRRALRSASMRLPSSGQRSWRPLLWKSKPSGPMAPPGLPSGRGSRPDPHHTRCSHPHPGCETLTVPVVQVQPSWGYPRCRCSKVQAFSGTCGAGTELAKYRRYSVLYGTESHDQRVMRLAQKMVKAGFLSMLIELWAQISFEDVIITAVFSGLRESWGHFPPKRDDHPTFYAY